MEYELPSLSVFQHWYFIDKESSKCDKRIITCQVCVREPQAVSMDPKLV